MCCWCRSCWSQHSSFSLALKFWYESSRNLLLCCPPSLQLLDLWQKRWNKWEYERVLGGIAMFKLCTFIHIHCAFNHCMKWEVWLWEMNSILLHKQKWMRERGREPKKCLKSVYIFHTESKSAICRIIHSSTCSSRVDINSLFPLQFNSIDYHQQHHRIRPFPMVYLALFSITQITLLFWDLISYFWSVVGKLSDDISWVEVWMVVREASREDCGAYCMMWNFFFATLLNIWASKERETFCWNWKPPRGKRRVSQFSK